MKTISTRPSLWASMKLVGAYGARQIAWSRRTFVIILLILLPSVVAGFLRSNLAPGMASEYFAEIVPSFLLWVSGLVALFFGASMVRDGLEDHTLGYLLTRPVGRVRIAIGLFVGQVAVTLPLTVVGGVVAFATCFWSPSGWLCTEQEWTMLFGLLLTLAVGVLVYGAFFAAFGMWFKRPAILGIIWLQLVDWGFGSMPGPPRHLSLSGYMEETLPEGFMSRADLEPFSANRHSMGTAFLILIVIGVVALAVAGLCAARRDYVLAGDDD